MNALIVHAHPEPKSFTVALRDQASATPEAQGDAVQVSDLYAMNWNPVASAADFSTRANPDSLVYALEQRAGASTQSLSDDIQAELDKLQWADLLILNFPIYWFGMSAIMKGWIDRVFVSGYCYGGKRIYDRGGLKGKMAMLAFSQGGQRHMFGPGAVHGELEALLLPIHRGMLAYVGLQVLPPFVAYHVPYISESERRDYLDQYRQHLQTLHHRPALEFPRRWMSSRTRCAPCRLYRRRLLLWLPARAIRGRQPLQGGRDLPGQQEQRNLRRHQRDPAHGHCTVDLREGLVGYSPDPELIASLNSNKIRDTLKKVNNNHERRHNRTAPRLQVGPDHQGRRRTYLSKRRFRIR